MNAAIVHTAFTFLQQVLKETPEARVQLLQLLQTEISTVACPPLGDGGKLQTMPQLLAKKMWNKKDWQDVVNNFLHANKVPHGKFCIDHFIKNKQ